MQAIKSITMESPPFSSSSYCASSADTSTTAKSGLDILLFAAIDMDQESNQKTTLSSKPSSSSPKSSKSFETPTSVNPFRSKKDPRMRKSIEAKAMNPAMLDAEAVMVGFNFPKRGNNSDANWMGEGNVSMRQRKINFRRSWQRFHAKHANKTSASDFIMMQHQAELSRLLLQQQQYLNLLSQRTNRSRALLHSRMV